MIIYKHGKDVFEPQKSAYSTPETTTKLSASETKILQYLIENNGEIISREKLLGVGWPDKVVVANSLNVAIANLRKAFKTKAEIIITIKGAGFTIAKNTFIQQSISPNQQAVENHADTAAHHHERPVSDADTAAQQSDCVQKADATSLTVACLSGLAKFSYAASLIIMVTWVTLWASSWQSPPCISIDGREVCGNLELLELENLPEDPKGKLYIDMIGNLHEES